MFILSEKDRSLEMEAKKFKGYTIAETGESVDVEYGVGKSTYNTRRMDKMIITSPDGRQIGPVASMAEAKREINRDIDIRGLSKIRTRHICMIPDSDINETTMSIIFERCVFIMKERGESAQAHAAHEGNPERHEQVEPEQDDEEIELVFRTAEEEQPTEVER